MLKKLAFRPGVVKSNSEYAVPGRYTDAQWVRFVAGFPQKKGGYESAIDDALTGLCRNVKVWRDNSEVARAAFGTHSKLFVLTQGTLTDVTPLRGRTTGALTDPISTTSGSSTVMIDHTAHNQQVGDWVTLTAASAVGGLTIAGNYVIKTVPTADSYTIDAGSDASSTAGPGGGSTSYTYFRKLLGSNPIATTLGSTKVTITDAANTTTEGDTVIISGATAVGGLTLSGSYIIETATTNAYTVDAGSAAASTATGGGSSVIVQNEISVGLGNTAQGHGWGVGSYGNSFYGTPRTTSVTLILRVWSLHAYGEWLLASPRGGGLYVWDPTVGGRAIGLYRAPTELLGFFVTAERYIVALGKDGDSLKLGWPDQTDPTAWTATTSNTANESRRIAGGNYIVAGSEVRNQTSLIWTDTAAFLHQWRADNYVFTTAKLADFCGLIGPNAFTVLGEAAWWIGSNKQFWKWDGALSIVQSDDIADWFFANVDLEQSAKIVMGSIAEFNELIILYQEIGSDEINRYLLYNILDGTWSVGELARTAWVDKTLFTYPIAVDADGGVWNHEAGVDGDGAAIEATLTAAPLDADEGEENLDIMGFLPDFERLTGSLSLYVLTRNRAMETPSEDGPYTISSVGDAIDLRSSGKMVGFRLASNVVGGNFRIGLCRVDAQTAGSRR